MRPLMLFLLMVLSAFSAKSQTIKTKDGLELGPRRQFVKNCAKSAGEEYVDFNGKNVEFKKICECMADEVIPRITSVELISASQSDDGMTELMMRDDIYPHIEMCVLQNIDDITDLEFDENTLEEGSLSEKAARESCINGMMEGDEDYFTLEQAEVYCDCAINAIREKGYSFSDLMLAEDESSEVFNEVVIPCVVEILADDPSILEEEELNYYTGEVGFENETREVELSTFNDQYKIKLTIGDHAKYYLLDTGASDVLIDQAFAETLMEDGVISEKDRVGSDTYQLADGSMIECPIYLVPEMSSGDVVIRNLEVGVMDEGGFLCGMSFLNSFLDWELDEDRSVLILKN